MAGINTAQISMTLNHAHAGVLLFLLQIKRGKKTQDVFPQFITVSAIACRGEKLAVRQYYVTSVKLGAKWRKGEPREGHIYPTTAQPQSDNSVSLSPSPFHNFSFFPPNFHPSSRNLKSDGYFFV